MNSFDTIIGRVAEENDASIHLNEHAGFVHVGTLKEVGRKFARLLGVRIMQKDPGSKPIRRLRLRIHMCRFAFIPSMFTWVRLGVAAAETVTNLSEYFGGRDGCFNLCDARNESHIRHNVEGCAERFSPCSTFKIPHTLIVLHTGVASGADFSIAWDGVKRGESWDRDAGGRQALRITEAILERLGI